MYGHLPLNQNPTNNYYYPGQNINPPYIQSNPYHNYPPNNNIAYDPSIIDEEAHIDKFKDIKNKDLGFDLSLLERDELNVNLIHFDVNITNKENYTYYNKFKVDVVGGYITMDNIYMLYMYLEAIKNKKIPFVVLSTGYHGNNVIKICKRYPFIREVIIFCGNYEKYKHYLNEFTGFVNRVFTNFSEVHKYIKFLGQQYNKGIKEFRKSNDFIFSPEDIQMNKQLEQCPVISAYEYDNCYYLIHRAYASFFTNDKKNFTKYNFDKIKEYIINCELLEEQYKPKLINQFESLVDKENFVERSIREYTRESHFCYFFNRIMRNFDVGVLSLAYYMGPFLLAAYNYVLQNQSFGIYQDMKLYRNIECSLLDFYLYKINLNHIICFPSITSTSLTIQQNNNPFKITSLAQQVNKIESNTKNMIKVRMIFKYKYQQGNISPGILVLDYKGKDNLPLSDKSSENEVILFPFTFARITNIVPQGKEQGKDKFDIHFDIIPRVKYIELTLKDNVENRYKFNDLDKQYNK